MPVYHVLGELFLCRSLVCDRCTLCLCNVIVYQILSKLRQIAYQFMFTNIIVISPIEVTVISCSKKWSCQPKLYGWQLNVCIQLLLEIPTSLGSAPSRLIVAFDLPSLQLPTPPLCWVWKVDLVSHCLKICHE